MIIGQIVKKPCENNNPYRGSCVSFRPVLNEIFHSNNDYKLKLIFTTSNDKNDNRSVVARRLLVIHKTFSELTEKSLDE